MEHPSVPPSAAPRARHHAGTPLHDRGPDGLWFAAPEPVAVAQIRMPAAARVRAVAAGAVGDEQPLAGLERLAVPNNAASGSRRYFSYIGPTCLSAACISRWYWSSWLQPSAPANASAGIQSQVAEAGFPCSRCRTGFSHHLGNLRLLSSCRSSIPRVAPGRGLHSRPCARAQSSSD